MKKKLSSSILAMTMVFGAMPSMSSVTEVFADNSAVDTAIAMDSNVDVVSEIYNSFANNFGGVSLIDNATINDGYYDTLTDVLSGVSIEINLPDDFSSSLSYGAPGTDFKFTEFTITSFEEGSISVTGFSVDAGNYTSVFTIPTLDFANDVNPTLNGNHTIQWTSAITEKQAAISGGVLDLNVKFAFEANSVALAHPNDKLASKHTADDLSGAGLEGIMDAAVGFVDPDDYAMISWEYDNTSDDSVGYVTVDFKIDTTFAYGKDMAQENLGFEDYYSVTNLGAIIGDTGSITVAVKVEEKVSTSDIAALPGITDPTAGDATLLGTILASEISFPVDIEYDGNEFSGLVSHSIDIAKEPDFATNKDLTKYKENIETAYDLNYILNFTKGGSFTVTDQAVNFANGVEFTLTEDELKTGEYWYLISTSGVPTQLGVSTDPKALKDNSYYNLGATTYFNVKSFSYLVKTDAVLTETSDDNTTSDLKTELEGVLTSNPAGFISYMSAKADGSVVITLEGDDGTDVAITATESNKAEVIAFLEDLVTGDVTIEEKAVSPTASSQLDTKLDDANVESANMFTVTESLPFAYDLAFDASALTGTVYVMGVDASGTVIVFDGPKSTGTTVNYTVPANSSAINFFLASGTPVATPGTQGSVTDPSIGSGTGSSSSSSSNGYVSGGSGTTSYYNQGSVRVNGSYVDGLKDVLIGEMINLNSITPGGNVVEAWYTDSAMTQEISNIRQYVITQSAIDNGIYARISGTTTGGTTTTTPDANTGNTGNTVTTPSTVPSTIAKLLGKLF